MAIRKSTPCWSDLDLLALPYAAEDHGGSEAEAAAIGAETIVDITGKLARRRKNERMRTPRRAWPALLRQAVQIGNAKAAVLPVPVWAMPSKSRPSTRRGNRLRLNRRRLEIVFGLERRAERLRQPKAVERSRCHL